MFLPYLRADSEHFKGRWHIEPLGDFDVPEIDGEGFAPDAEMTDIENSQVSWEGQDDGFPVVSP